jgi:predicted secreted acid phosphatase
MFFILACTLFSQSLFAEPPNISLLKQEIQAYHDSGTYQKELKQVIYCATNFVNHRANTNNKSAHPEKLAIVLDIDETSLSNYYHIVAHQFSVDHEQIHRDILAANAPVIKPMLQFYNDALRHGVTVFFVTGRRESERNATIKNLKAAGYHDWSGLYLRPENYKDASIIPFKSQARASISKLGYTVIASIGDQHSDLKGGYAEKTFKLPNPYYYLP